MNSNSIKIMTLGDSITQAENGYNSYRKVLWEQLNTAGYNVDFVGSENKNKDNNDFLDNNFDPDHEGHWGWRIDEIINGRPGEGRLSDWLTGYTPDVVLIHLGSNDAIQSNSAISSVEELNQVIDILRQDNPNVTIFLSQLIPAVDGGRNSRIEQLNSLIPGVVTDKNQANSPVILVDQNSGFNAGADTYDGVHPNSSGEAKMAQKWFDALKDYFDNVNINPQENNSEAINDSATTVENSSVNIAVLANDNLASGKQVNLIIPSSSNNGTLALNNNGTPGDTTDDFVVYNPNSGFTGQDSFTYSLDDGNGVVDTATVNVTVTQLPPNNPSTRVNSGLLALYNFDEGSGNTVFDVSGVGTALNLEINNLTGVSWGNGILNLNSSSLIASNGAATKIINGITSTEEITLEAWITPSNRSQNGPARIATLSSDVSNRNFTLGQAGDDYNVRLRTTTTGNNGVGTSVSSNGGLLSTELTHVVYTREADGDAFLYIDNQLVATENIGGNFSNWNNNYRLGLGNEFNGDRPWLGSYDLFAVYNQAFDANEVQQNFLAGADGSQSPTPNTGGNAPVAANDNVTTNEDTAVNINVLANDNDGDGDSLNLVSVTNGSNGTTEIVGNEIIYTPEANFNGVDSFSYSLNDGNGGTDSATVTVNINPVNDQPIAENDTATTNEDTGVTINVLANDSDVDGDNLNIVSVTSGSNGTTEIVDNEIIYIPEANFSGQDSFTYSIDDGNGVTDTATVSVTVRETGSNNPSDRVDSGLLALYNFDEGSGNTVFDVSGVGTALNLEINNLTGVSWGNGILNLNSSSLIASNGAATKIINGITSTEEITLEAWITPSNRSQNGPARIATLSSDVSNRNFTLGQAGDDYNVRLRTTTTGNNGVGTSVSSNGGLLNTELTHVVYTREADGDAFLYIDNQLVATENIGGNFSNWNNNYRLGLGNEFNGDRPWLGSYDLFAVYNQAFDANEVQQNFLAGADGSQSPPTNTENTIPTAENDSVTTNEDTGVTINVLANDSDVDGDNLTIVSVTSGSNGTTEIVDNEIIYIPEANFSGQDSFTYSIDDGNGVTDTATVNVTVRETGSNNPSDRVDSGLLALYNFDEGSGNTVFDVSGVGTALNLEIDNLTGVNWGDGILNLNSSSLIASNGAATKIIDGITSTEEITLEAWITPSNRSQNGPARIATLSSDIANRNFTLGQAGDDYNVRLRTTTTGNNGVGTSVSSNGGLLSTELTHVVYTREADGDAFLYIDNQLVATENIDGDFSNWDDDYRLGLGNELSGDRPWLGSYDLFAVYNQAFDANEVQQNFLAGSDI